MRRIPGRRPSPSMIVAVFALFVALGGSAVAATLINGKNIKNRTIAGNKLKKDTLTGTEIKESKLGKVPKAKVADNASRLQGARASDFVSHAELRNVSARLALNQTVTIATNGTVAVKAHCLNDGTNDIVRVFATTSAANSFSRGDNSFSGGTAATNFLQPTTTEDNSRLAERTQGQTITTPLVGSDIDSSWVVGADGSYIGLQGDQTALGINAFGSKCSVVGTVALSKQ